MSSLKTMNKSTVGQFKGQKRDMKNFFKFVQKAIAANAKRRDKIQKKFLRYSDAQLDSVRNTVHESDSGAAAFLSEETVALDSQDVITKSAEADVRTALDLAQRQRMVEGAPGAGWVPRPWEVCSRLYQSRF